MRSFSDYFDFKTELSFHSYNNYADDKIFGTVILTSVINYTEVINLNSNSSLKTQSKRIQIIDRVVFVNENKDTEVFGLQSLGRSFSWAF